MSHVKSHGNKSTEIRLIKIFKDNKITGWRRNYPLPGKPDFVFPPKKIVVFVDGCFWHGCPLHGSIPKTKQEFWMKKLNRNMERDKEVNTILSERGWRVIRFWEHELKDPRNIISKFTAFYEPNLAANKKS